MLLPSPILGSREAVCAKAPITAQAAANAAASFFEWVSSFFKGLYS
jgi:hypothetical protein